MLQIVYILMFTEHATVLSRKYCTVVAHNMHLALQTTAVGIEFLDECIHAQKMLLSRRSAHTQVSQWTR